MAGERHGHGMLCVNPPLRVCHGMDGQSVEGLAQCSLPVSSLIRHTGNNAEGPKDNSGPGHTTVLPMHLQYLTDYR